MSSKVSNAVKVVVPPMPFERTDFFNVDEKLIAAVAAEYNSASGTEASNLHFFLGYLPIWSVDGLCAETCEKAYVKSLLGNFTVSGFFGGVWLRDEIKLTTFKGMRTGKLFKRIHRGASKVFEFAIKRLVNAALKGSDRSVRILSRSSIEPFLILNGYNWGYFDYIMKNPPEGAEPPERYRELYERFLDCRMPGVRIAVLEKYKTVLDCLYARRGEAVAGRWREMKAVLITWKKFSAATGSFVWHIIMNDSMPGPVYELLLELSARFLLIAELCILPAMKCYAEGDIEAGRAALLQQAGMIAWAGSYMVGLTSDLPEGTFPAIDIKQHAVKDQSRQ